MVWKSKLAWVFIGTRAKPPFLSIADASDGRAVRPGLKLPAMNARFCMQFAVPEVAAVGFSSVMVWVIFRGPSRIGTPREPSDYIVPRYMEATGEPSFVVCIAPGLRGLRPAVRLPPSVIATAAPELAKVAYSDGDFAGLGSRVRGEAGLMSVVRKLFGAIGGSLRRMARESWDG